eukprot:12106045-Alexandrium_andersonii.AAC.1
MPRRETSAKTSAIRSEIGTCVKPQMQSSELWTAPRCVRSRTFSAEGEGQGESSVCEFGHR